MIGLVAMGVIATAVDTVFWGWKGFVLTGLGTLVLLAFIYLGLGRRFRTTR